VSVSQFVKSRRLKMAVTKILHNLGLLLMITVKIYAYYVYACVQKSGGT